MSVWDGFGIVCGISLESLSMILGSCFDHFGIGFGFCLIVLGSLFDYVWIAFSSFWDNVRTVWDHF